MGEQGAFNGEQVAPQPRKPDLAQMRSEIAAALGDEPTNDDRVRVIRRAIGNSKDLRICFEGLLEGTSVFFPKEKGITTDGERKEDWLDKAEYDLELRKRRLFAELSKTLYSMIALLLWFAPFECNITALGHPPPFFL